MLLLLRHGETIANARQIYQGQGNGILSKNGIEQARLLSKHFARMPINIIYSSDLERSIETAGIIAKPHKLNVIQMPGLRERYYGDWEGLQFDEIAKKYKKLYKTWLINPVKAIIPNAETLKALQKRAIKAINEIIDINKGKTILIVGHGGINRTILFHFLNMGLNSFWRIKQDNCCLNIIDFTDSIPKVSLLNSTCFLGEKRLRKHDVLA
jgi:broad specificity phosphatase PhoE